MLADRRYGYLLTVTNHAFRYLLVCEATESNAEKPAFTALEHPFRELGCRRTSVPTTAFRSLPKVCSTSPRVSVLWLRLGISLERIKPGHSQQNSRHETQAAAARWRQYPTRAGRVRRFHRKVQPFLVLSFVRPVEASLVA